MDNDAWAESLTFEVEKVRPAGQPKRTIRLPSGLKFGGTADRATIEISAAGLRGNMQTDAAAFDGWAWVLRRWLGVRRFSLFVSADGERSGPHFERFVFRLDRFCDLFGDVALDPALADAVAVGRFRSPEAVLNVARTSRGYDGIPTATNSESDLELLLCHNDRARGHLMDRFGLERLCRQFPVGLFLERVSAPTRIFTGGKSAIDLVGVAPGGTFHIFELKKPKNAKVGAVSELVFYTAALEQARIGRWRFDRHGKLDPRATVKPAHVEDALFISGHLLATDFHPLVDDELLETVSAAMIRAGWRTSIDRVDLAPFVDAASNA
jgi:hypothetical protein